MISPQPIRVMVVDKRPEIRESLDAFLASYEDFDPVGSVTNGVQAIFLAVRVTPDVALVGVLPPEGHVTATISALNRASPHTRILMYCDSELEELANETLKVGAVGYVLMNISPDDLKQAIRTANARVATVSG